MNYHWAIMTKITRTRVAVAYMYRHTRLHLSPSPLLYGQLIVEWVPVADAAKTLVRPQTILFLLESSYELAVRVRVKLPLCP